MPIPIPTFIASIASISINIKDTQSKSSAHMGEMEPSATVGEQTGLSSNLSVPNILTIVFK